MAERAPVEVAVQIDGQDQTAGTLWIHDRGGQTASFRYAGSYLTRPDSYALDPALPKAAGVFHTPARLSTAIDLDDNKASIEVALSLSDYFRLSVTEARAVISDVERATAHWRNEAAALGLPRQQIDRMADAYETAERRTAREQASR